MMLFVFCMKQTSWRINKVATMKRWIIVGYAECEGTYYLPRKEKVVQAPNKREAERIAMREFPEYHEIGAFEAE